MDENDDEGLKFLELNNEDLNPIFESLKSLVGTMEKNLNDKAEGRDFSN